MNLLRKTVISSAVVAFATLLLSLTSPRTAHALAALGATLVHITNTEEAPAIVEEVPHTASHTITLIGYVVSPSYGEPFTQLSSTGNVTTTAFVVPVGQSFIITSVDITPSANTSSWINIGNYNGGWYGGWTVPGMGTTEYQYPSGVVVASGETLDVSSGQSGTSVIVHGYLTSI
jgi:hypothetical protein